MSKSTKVIGAKSKVHFYVGGTFDLLHSGHIKLFETLKKKGKVTVSLNTDEFAERYKRKPVMPLRERLAVIKQLRCVDEVIINAGDEDSRPAILSVKPTHIVHGDDWTGQALLRQMGLTQQFLKKHKIKLTYLPYTQGISSTLLWNTNGLTSISRLGRSILSRFKELYTPSK